MFKITEKNLQEINDLINSNANRFSYNVNLFGYNSCLRNYYTSEANNRHEFKLVSQCHAHLPTFVNNYNVVANCFNRGTKVGVSKDVINDFLEWLVSDDSVYYPLIKRLKETNDYHIIRNNSTKEILAVVVGNPKTVNFKVLTNFFKAGRTVNEHIEKLIFWDKWKIQAGFDPGLVFLMMYNVSHLGDKITNGHSCLESWANNKKIVEVSRTNDTILLDKFVNRDHDYWDLNLYKNNFSQTEENRYTWGIKSTRFKNIKNNFLSHEIREKSKEISKTFFYHLYLNDLTKAAKITDDTLKYFFTEGYKEYLIDYKPPQVQTVTTEKPEKPVATKKKRVVRRKKVVLSEPSV